MKQGQISQEQIIGILQQAERGEHTVAAICRAHGITETTFSRWRKKYGDMSVAEAARLRELERENARLKRLLAERDLELAATKERLTKKRSSRTTNARLCGSWSRAGCQNGGPVPW